MAGVDVRIDADQVLVRADSMFDGYLNDDDSRLTPDGYYITGDLGRISASGTLFLTGRTTLLIDVGGLKVNPLEVEEVLTGHPDVGLCVVLPMPLSSTVTRLKAILTPRPGRPAPFAQSLRAWRARV